MAYLLVEMELTKQKNKNYFLPSAIREDVCRSIPPDDRLLPEGIRPSRNDSPHVCPLPMTFPVSHTSGATVVSVLKPSPSLLGRIAVVSDSHLNGDSNLTPT